LGVRQGITLGVLLLVTTFPDRAYAQQQETRSCEFRVKARCVSGQASVTLTNGIVNSIAIDIFWCGLRGRPGYRCEIDASRTDEGSAWSEDAGATVIANSSPWNPAAPDRFKVTVGRHVSIDFAEAQSLGRCGAGAELPRAIVIPAGATVCRVWLGSP
jgi:hypothetical protein